MRDETRDTGNANAAEGRFRVADIPVPVPLACVGAYFLPVVGGIFFLFAERTNRLIRFHAAQSVLFWILFVIFYAVAGVVESGLLEKLVSIVLLISWCYVIYESMHRNLCRLPFIGDIAYGMIFDGEEM